jgi:uncharacterized protein (TIGR03435 family)
MYLGTVVLAASLLSSTICRMFAQDRAAAKLQEFEVASVKPVQPNVPHMVGVKVYPGGRVVISTMPLKGLTAIAFRLSYWQISGGDAWAANEEYDVEAKPAPDAHINDLRHTSYGIESEKLREMLQALLINRFQLKFHRETKTGDVYRMERSGKALALHPSEGPSQTAAPADDRGSFGSVGYVAARWGIYSTSMPQLAKFASDNILHAPVVDRTELSGSFDYKQRQPDAEPNYSDNSDSFLRFIAEMGLKLERAKGPVEVFVIDHAAKPLPN